MDEPESVLDIARRCVVEVQVRVDRQTVLVRELAHEGRDTAEAEIMLSSLRDALALMHDVVTRYEVPTGRPDAP